MRMMPLLAIVVALGLSLFVLGGLGVSQFGSGGEVGLQEEVNDSTKDEESIDPEEGDDGGFFSFVVGGLGRIRELVGIALFLPSTLRSLGAPGVLASAVGRGTQLIILVGLVQIALQFDIR